MRTRRDRPSPLPPLLAPVLALPLVALSHPVAPSAGGAPPAASAVRLTRDGGFKQHLQWSPDGARLLLTRIHEGRMGLWLMNVDGSGLKPLLSPEPNTVQFDGHWSPDGKRVAYVHDVQKGTAANLQINSAAADGTDVRVLVPQKGLEESPRWAPDGKCLAWVSTRDGNQ